MRHYDFFSSSLPEVVGVGDIKAHGNNPACATVIHHGLQSSRCHTDPASIPGADRSAPYSLMIPHATLRDPTSYADHSPSMTTNRVVLISSSKFHDTSIPSERSFSLRQKLMSTV